MNNLYNFNSIIEEPTIDSKEKKTYIKPGIQENLFLIDIKYDKTEKGNEFLAFYFKDKFGDELSHTEWPPRADKPIESMNEKEREDLIKKVENQKKRIKQIVKTYLPNETFDFRANSFEEFAKLIISLLKGKVENVPVRVKVVLSDDNFTTLPKYSKYTFIEPMTITTEQSRMRLLNIDKVERVVPNIKSKSSTVEIETGSETTEIKEEVKNPNDLPF